ncbi:hypothetical protein BpHYR1_043034 [Brachionus plicatilis]|uniref:Uncharacterized protein n=1 Tax=Brachionus plicatilis TaxID=10195 RepID=A0A3M7QMG9_BRAPC|nr:hypothetical protein BpHYR1_043034 [Brachionus plicatilis]
MFINKILAITPKNNFCIIRDTDNTVPAVANEIINIDPKSKKNTIRKTVMLRRVVTPMLTFSPLSGGIKNPKNPTIVISILGSIMLNT